MKKSMILVGSLLLTGVITTGFIFGSSVFAEKNKNQPLQEVVVQTVSDNMIDLSSTVSRELSGDIQEITVNVEPFGYPEISVEVNKPVRINFKATKENLNACNNEIIIPSLNISKKLNVGDNFVEFTPDKEGTIPYSCWMDMIKSNIIVTSGTQTANEIVKPTTQPTVAPTVQAKLTPTSVTPITAVSTVGDVTVIEAKIAPGGYPEIIVEKDKPVRINFKADAADLNSCNNELYIPEWDITKKLSVGDNFVEFTPTKTGTFNYSCWMGMIGSSITVVDVGTAEVGALPMDESANYAKGCGMMSGNTGDSSLFGGMMGGGGGGGCCGR